MTTFNDDESARLHRLWVAHFRKKHREWDRYEVLNEMYDALDWRQRRLMPELQPPSLPFPEELRNMRCDARTRAGTPCKRKDLWGSGRCKLHSKVQVARWDVYRTEDQTGQAAVIKKRVQAQTDFMRAQNRDFPDTPIIHTDAGCLMTAVGNLPPFVMVTIRYTNILRWVSGFVKSH